MDILSARTGLKLKVIRFIVFCQGRSMRVLIKFNSCNNRGPLSKMVVLTGTSSQIRMANFSRMGGIGARGFCELVDIEIV